MSEFKVGDRVKMTAVRRYGIVVGEKEILGTKKHYPVLFDDDNSNCLVPEEDLEIVDEHGKTLLEQRIEKLEKCVIGEQNSLEKCANVSSMSKNGLLTEDERVILRNLDKRCKWIIRNEHYITATEKKPKLEKSGWGVEGGFLADLPFTKLFKFIKFEDDEPYNIEELLKGECGNE